MTTSTSKTGATSAKRTGRAKPEPEGKPKPETKAKTKPKTGAGTKAGASARQPAAADALPRAGAAGDCGTADMDALRARMVAAALALAPLRGWRALSVADIAAQAGIPLAEALAATPSKTAILRAFSRAIDAQVLNDLDPEELAGEPARDRLFDVLMRRYDALWPHRAALRAILRDLPEDPGALLAALGPALESVAWMLEAAELDTSGLRGAVRVRVAGAILAANMRVWLAEESADMPRTMADLDRRLRQVEGWAEQAGTLMGRLGAVVRRWG